MMAADVSTLCKALFPISMQMRNIISPASQKLTNVCRINSFSTIAIENKSNKDNKITNIASPFIRNIHTTNLLCKKLIAGSENWPKKNKIVYPPQEPQEERRPAWVCHHRDNIRYSTKKMWYIASLIRGMSVDEAIKQLSFVPRKGAHIVKEVLQEAQELAVKEHHVEYKSNLWVGESFCGKGRYVKGLRKHARMRFGIVEYKYCHYYVRLVEGPPPKHYYPPELTGNEKLQEYIQELRNRTIIWSL